MFFSLALQHLLRQRIPGMNTTPESTGKGVLMENFVDIKNLHAWIDVVLSQ